MSLADITGRHHAERQQIIRAAERAGIQVWRQVDTAAIAPSWSALMSRVLAALVAAQTAAAGQADAYTAAVLAELGIDADVADEVVPESLAGQSADGRDLRRLLLTPQVVARSGLSRGRSLAQAMASGQAALQLLLRTEVADAGRVADGIAVAVRPKLGYVRHVTPPSCARCSILAGRFYRFNAGFQRHPACDCTHVPAPQSVSGDLTADPKRLFEEGQIRGLSKADAQAIRDGADMNRVVNAHRGMYTADGGRRATRALAGGQGIPRLRLRPETIYREAASRAEAIDLLRLHGYIR